MSQSSNKISQQEHHAFLAGGGEMGERTRAFDWSKTPVGPLTEWPQSLKIAMRIMLDSRYAMWLGWGPSFTFFYNDAYARMTLGPKHPWALGRSAREVWSEIWDDIGPRAESVVRTGQATWDEGLLLFLERRGAPEETYHTFSYSPIPDDNGNVGGMLCVVTEDTQKVIGERRLSTLRELAARTNEEAKSAEDACQTAASTLAANRHDLPFVLFYLIDPNSKIARLAGAAGLPKTSAASPGCVNMADEEGQQTGWPLGLVLKSGRSEVVTDLEKRFGSLPGGLWPDPPQQAVVLPMSKPGQARLAGFVVAGVSPRQPFDDGYKGFMDLLAGQVATAVANARAYEEERRRAEALAELDRAKTAFFSNVSHEFRTPLALMLGPVEDALAEMDGELPPSQRERLQVAHRNALRLQKLVNTLLDFSRIEAGRSRALYEPTDLAAYTADLASNFRSACEKAGLELKVDCSPLPLPVFVDRQMWEKIVLNLLSNAFKFTFQGEIVVSLRIADHRAEVRVRDTGTGIPPEEIPRLFERFHRVENAHGRTHEGSGIGLALVHELVKLHGGSISAESTIGIGTTFIISIPLGTGHLPQDQIGGSHVPRSTQTAASAFVEEALRWLPDQSDGPRNRAELLPDQETPSVSLACADDSNRPRVLIADDNADMRHYLTRLLADRYTVKAVPDGKEALAAVRQQAPNLILSDIMMPKLDGFGLLRELRADPHTASVPIILLSARAGEESRVEGMEAGADDYLVKPFSARELLARIGALLQINSLRREAEQAIRKSEERFRVLFETMSEGFAIDEIIFDEAGKGCDLRYLEVNPAFERHTGLKRADILGRRTLELFPDAEPHWFERYGQVATTGVPAHFQARFGPLDLWFEVSAYRTGPNQLAIVFFDITEKKQAEDTLKDANRRKDEFLATLAHELRNPLAPIRNSLQILKMPRLDAVTLERSREMMERQVHQLVRLVDDLLDVSRVMRGKIELRKERIELATVVARAVETVQPLIESQGHELTVSLPSESLPLDVDPVRLAQVVGNLLTNAAKYTETNGRIWLTAERDGENAVLRVRDTGIGIAPDMLPHIFELFVQVDHAATRSQGGLGIGLTLVKNLVEMHHGTVEASSDGLGRGSEFAIRLPLLRLEPTLAVENNHGEPQRDTMRTSGQRLLVVDDNRDAADSLAMLLRLQGQEVRVANDGVAALEIMQNFRPVLVFLDLGMPKMDGYEVARRLRRQSGLENIRLAALTGWGQQEDRRRTAEAGFDYHFVKPVEPKAIEGLLAELGSPKE